MSVLVFRGITLRTFVVIGGFSTVVQYAASAASSDNPIEILMENWVKESLVNSDLRKPGLCDFYPPIAERITLSHSS